MKCMLLGQKHGVKPRGFANQIRGSSIEFQTPGLPWNEHCAYREPSGAETKIWLYRDEKVKSAFISAPHLSACAATLDARECLNDAVNGVESCQ